MSYRPRLWFAGAGRDRLLAIHAEGSLMRRREFTAGLGGAAAWPLAVRAQQATKPVVGVLHSASPDGFFAQYVTEFRRGLAEAAYVEGRDVAIEYRFAEGQYDRLPAVAADLVRRQMSAIFATGTAPSLAARAATGTIPIVFSIGGDPVRYGLVASFSRPGGNVTGISQLGNVVTSKQIELLREMMPRTIALIMNPNNPNAASDISDAKMAAQTVGQQIIVLNASTARDIDTAFSSLSQQGADAILVATDAFLFDRRDQIVGLAARYAVLSVFSSRELATAGGLMAYTGELSEGYRLAGIYIGRILNGEKPANLPVQQVTKMKLVINLKTAKALGLTIPETLLATADEVIQ
jgi:putative tryptophan/tyrosine transport system substrate-binding protein